MALPAFLDVLVPDHLLLSFFMFALLYSFLMPISEEIALVVIGIIAATWLLPLWLVAIVVYPGLLLSDYGYYGLARHFGVRLLDTRLLRRLIKREKVFITEVYFAHKGHWIVFFCRFVVGLRAHAMIAAGLLRMPFRTFALYDGLSAVVSCALWLGIGYYWRALFVNELNVDTMGRFFALAAPLFVIFGGALIYRVVSRDFRRIRDSLL